MRIATSTSYVNMGTALNDALGRVQQLQDQLSSGKRIQQFSDAPSDAASALTLRAKQDSWASWSRASDDATARLNLSDSTLQSASAIMTQIKELTVGAVNGSLDATSRSALSAQVLQLRDQLGNLANTSYLGTSLFGGFGANAVANIGGTWSYVGDAGQVKRQIGDGVVIAANVDGKQAFGFNGPGPNLFTALNTLAADINSGNVASLQADSATLDARASDINATLGTIGSRVNQVAAVSQQGQAVMGQLQSERSKLEDIDLAETMMKLNIAQTGYQAALAAASKGNLPSLADYLK